MANTSSFPPPVSPETQDPIALADSIFTLGPHWHNWTFSYNDPLVERPREENYSHPISAASSRIIPWSPDPRLSLSGFMPRGELGGAVSSLASTAHTAPSISVPSTMEVTACDSPSELLAHGTQYPDDQRAAPPFSQHAGSFIYVQVPVIPPFPDLYECSQASRSATMQSQPQLNLDNISGVEQQQPTPHDYTRIDSRDDFANPNSSPMSSGSSEMSHNEWTGMLNLNGTRVPVRALLAEAVGDLKLSVLPTELAVETAVGLKLSILAIEAWIRKNNAPMVRLSYVDGTENCDFDWLVKEIRAHGYAIVTCENRDRLLLAALGNVLLCAAFPEKGTLRRPTPQPPRKVRTVTRKDNPQKNESSQKKRMGKPRQRNRPYPATTSKSSNDLCDGLHPEAATQSTIALQQPQPEQPQMPYYPQVPMESMQGEINPSNQWHQMDGSAQHQMISPPLFQVEHQAYLQAPQGVLGALGEQLVRRDMGTDTVGCMADLSNLKSEPMEVAEMYGYMDIDGYWVRYDSAS